MHFSPRLGLFCLIDALCKVGPKFRIGDQGTRLPKKPAFKLTAASSDKPCGFYFVVRSGHLYGAPSTKRGALHHGQAGQANGNRHETGRRHAP